MEKRNQTRSRVEIRALSEAITNWNPILRRYHEVFFGIILSTFVHRRRFTYEPE